MGKRILALTLAITLLLAGCSSRNENEASESSESESVSSSPFEPIEDPAATRTAPTDDAAVTLDDYTASMVVYTFYFSNMRETILGQARQNGYTDDNIHGVWEVVQEGVLIRDLLKNQALEVTKEYAILYHMAAEAGTEADPEADNLSDQQVDAYLADVGGDEQEFVNKYFLTPEQMKDVYRRINLIDAYQGALFEATEVTEEEIKKAHEENEEFYQLVRARHILIEVTDTMTDDEKKEAEETARDLFKRVEDGEDIGVLAAEFSQDPGSKDNNGEYIFGKGQMVQEFEDWAFSAKPGEIGLVETDFGYHVMQLMADSSYESVKPLVENDVKIDKASESFAEIPELVASDKWVVKQDAIDALNP